MIRAKALGVLVLLVVLAISPCPARAYELLDLKAKVLHKCMMYIEKTAELMPKRSCHTRFQGQNRMHNYMYARIKFHTYRDIISE